MYSETVKQVRMAGESNCHTTREVVVVGEEEEEEEVVAVLVVQIWNAMNVVSLVILLVNAVCVVVVVGEGAVAAARLDIAEVLVMAEGDAIISFHTFLVAF